MSNQDIIKTKDELIEELKELRQQVASLKNIIADQQKTEVMEQANAHKFQTLLQDAPVAIVIVNSQEKIDTVNGKTEEMFGYDQAELIGQPIEVLLPERFRSVHAKHWSNYFANPRIRPMGLGLELTGKHKDGYEIPVDIGLSFIKSEAGTLVVSFIADISERKQAEEALARYAEELARSNAELEQFAYVASHDLQEPLRMVTSYLQLLEQRYSSKLDDDAQEFINYAVDGSNRMKQLINDLLTYSRVSTRGKPFEPTNCEEVLEQTLNSLQLAIADTQAAITHHPLPVVMADGGQLGQLFQNLIGNALKYRSQVSPKIAVDAKLQGDEWLFSVADNGIGIEPEFAEQIFVIFHRAHNQDEYSGTGIGLATCKKIVERHGGHIWVESQPGKGSTFYFTIPNITEKDA